MNSLMWKVTKREGLQRGNVFATVFLIFLFPIPSISVYGSSSIFVLGLHDKKKVTSLKNSCLEDSQDLINSKTSISGNKYLSINRKPDVRSEIESPR